MLTYDECERCALAIYLGAPTPVATIGFSCSSMPLATASVTTPFPASIAFCMAGAGAGKSLVSACIAVTRVSSDLVVDS